ncbi:MAG: hypothetical protein POELPBGB_01693 [Bacteroidia bacterium]|nr:hypothetical protein [Bacteroidia bacterium]
MSTPVFSFSENPFLNGTVNSYKKMNIISADTDSKLYGQQANPLIAPAFAYFNPYRALYSQKYIAWKSKLAAYHGATAYVYILLAQLSGDKIEEFDIKIQLVHRRETPRYIALMPDYRGPFQTGEIDERIAALATLIENIGSEAALAAVKADIIAFHTIIAGARNDQQALEGEANTKSAELEHERVACAQAMYAVLGMLMTVYNVDPSQIADYFDLETLRGHVSDVVDLLFDGPIGAGQIVNVLNPTVTQYEPGVTLRIKNTTSGPAIGGLYFYPADNATDGWTGLGYQLNPGEEITLTLNAAQFRAFFNVQNQGPNLQTYEVEIILPA